MKFMFLKYSILFKKNILILLFALFSLLVCFINNGIRYNFWISITSFIIIFISIINIFKIDGKPYSINKIFFLFILFFLGVAPIIQFKHNIVIWSDTKFNDKDFIYTNIVIIGILILYNKFYNYFLRVKFKKIINIKGDILLKKTGINVDLFYILISLFSFILVLSFAKFNILSLLLRGAKGIEISSMISLLLHFLIRPIPVLCLIHFKLNENRNKLVERLLWLIILLCDFPTGLPRLQVAALYIPILFVYFKYFRNYYVFSLILIIGLFFAFPFFNMFRMQYIESLKEGNFVLFDENMFVKPHFDNYQNFMRIIKFDIITWGEQLLGVILFFIPRPLWPSKPVNSGVYIYEKLDLYFDNISVNYFAEGYINFGFIGILIFIIIIAYINARLDFFFWNKIKGNLFYDAKFSSIYLSVFGMEFFILRGALLGAFPITLGLIFSIYLIHGTSKRLK